MYDHPNASQCQTCKATSAGFHSDEGGIEALQAVLLLAIAAVGMLTIQPAWNSISKWTQNLITELLR